VTDGTADFHADRALPQFNEPGASLLPWRQSVHKVTVQTVDLARYIIQHVGRRRVDPEKPTKVVVKLDIEGLEHELFPALIVTGAVCNHVDSITRRTGGAAWSTAGSRTRPSRASSTTSSRRTRSSAPLTLDHVDDETFDTSTSPLPE